MAASLKHGHVVVCNNLGKISVRSLTDLSTKIASLKQAKKHCTAISYSPCENFLAVGSHDDHLYIYRIDSETHEYHLHAKDHRNSSFIHALDWTTDSRHIRTDSGDHEILYFDVEHKEPNTHGESSENFAGCTWATSTIVSGSDRPGLRPHDCENPKVHIKSVASNSDKMLVTGDAFGLVNVFNWPEPSCE